MSLIRGAIFFLLLLAGIGFAVMNDQPVSLRYYFGWVSPPLPVFLWAFLFLLLGLVLSSVWAFVSKMSLRSRIRQRRRALIELEQKQARMEEEKPLL